MKIVCTDNFDRGIYPEELVTSHSIDEDVAKSVANYLNHKFCGVNSPYFYKVVEDTYKLDPGFQP